MDCCALQSRVASVIRIRTERRRSARSHERHSHVCRSSSSRNDFTARSTSRQPRGRRLPRGSRWPTHRSRRGSRIDAPSGG